MTSASPITEPRIAATTDGWSSGTRPRLSPVSRYSAPSRSSRARSSGPGTPRAAAGDHQRPARRPQHLHRLRHRGRVGQHLRARPRRHQLGQQHRARHLGAQGVHGEVQVHRAGLAGMAQRARDGLVQLLQRQRRFAHGARIARERAHEVGVHHVLQRAAVFLRARRRARQHQHAGARDVALAMPVIALVTPGPAVTSATPRPPVSSACACAM